MKLEFVCNIGIFVYIDLGKMIFSEWILYYIGWIYKMDEVYSNEGGVIMDYMEFEKECGIMIISVVMSV